MAAGSPRTIIQEVSKEQLEAEDAKGEGDDLAATERSKLSSLSPKLNSAEILLQFGPETMNDLLRLIGSSFKMFWDGSISLYKDTSLSSTNNKEFLNKLLDVRVVSEQDQEPPVTLIHGLETELTLRSTLMTIKAE